jgi:hypothetical protein
MNVIDRTIHSQDAYVENLAAELTAAAYPVALRHGVAGSSIDLELDLWKALGETVQKWKRPPTHQLAETAQGDVGGERKSLRALAPAR